jgi:hypothetical protein
MSMKKVGRVWSIVGMVAKNRPDFSSNLLFAKPTIGARTIGRKTA